MTCNETALPSAPLLFQIVNGITITSASKEGKKGDGRRERRIKSYVKVNNERKEEKRQIYGQKEM
jgi:hypothetical protein